MRILRHTLHLLFVCCLFGCQEETEFVPIAPPVVPKTWIELDNLFIDTDSDMLLANVDGAQAYADGFLYQGDTIRTDSLVANFTEGVAYPVAYRARQHALYFTSLPILCIEAAETLTKEEKVGGTMLLAERGLPPQPHAIGIKLRGGWSTTFPKKSYTVELWQSPSDDARAPAPLLGMRDDDDWLLDALYNEPNRLRDYTAHGLWLDFGRCTSLPPDATPGIQRKYCEVFYNGSYRGLYYLGEKIDRKQLQLEHFDGQVRGQLYKGAALSGATSYRYAPQVDSTLDTWDGYEVKFPKQADEYDWNILRDHIRWVITASAHEFETEVSNRIDLANAVDYFLFINLLDAADNDAKNVYTARVDADEPYFFLPWDMDGIVGTDWQGERVSQDDNLHSNGLYTRLLRMPAFKADLKQRWQDVKYSLLSVEALVARFEAHYVYLKQTGVYEREAINEDLTQAYDPQEVEYIRAFLLERYAFLDAYILAL